MPEEQESSVEKPSIVLVWLKRDLRMTDHAPFRYAIESGFPVLPLYTFEPTLKQLPEWSPRHWRFAWECVQELKARLENLGIHLLVAHREVIPLLNLLDSIFQIEGLYSHQETGQKKTFDRDKAVKSWCKSKGIRWQEFRQDGVFRGLRNRANWQRDWQYDMNEPENQPDWKNATSPSIPPDLWDVWKGSPLPAEITLPAPGFQPGGMHAAEKYLAGFVDQRAYHYGRHLSKPGPSRRSCSRFSPYIAHGCLSVRQILKTTRPRLAEPDLGWNLKNFHSRLWWRSHYIQKLESEWQIEFEPINRGFLALDRNHDPVKFEAWRTGNTGIPMVDATMRCLRATGWTNFRLRATMATFATFALWLDWKLVAEELGRLFTDFEPGIHFAQMQMQAGLSGYHPMRLFNPIYQSEQHDPDGSYVRQWVPELTEVPAPLIYRPWRMTPLDQAYYQCRLGKDYPYPILDYDAAVRINKERYWKIRQTAAVQERLPALWDRHCIPENIEQYRKGEPPTVM